MKMNSPSRRDVLKGIGGAGALALGGVGAASAAGQGRREGASAGETIVEIAQDTPALSKLVEAVVAAGLADDLSGNRQLTVFAPTNQAFANLLAALPYGSLNDIPVDVLRNVLLYHVTAGRRYSESVLGAPEIPMLNGETVTVDGIVLNRGLAGEAELNTNLIDNEASNGVAHVIDAVLLPPALR